MLVGGLVSFADEIAFSRRSLHADGVVVGLAESTGGRRTMYRAIFTFDVEGKTHTVTDPSGSRPPSHNVGDRVDVVYDPGRPDEARVNSFMTRWIVPLILTGMGLIFTSVAVFVAVLEWRRR